ncbi:lysylphosphatidylglycerol synthase transmembrane domain-containing protein [Salsipaludibacter albus]|uniref:lysylphosphatidylglycerol synthase transmembrane domain-containing protein n=1 Tax=Salsipaludibacter albus TaxID=2849650 RepID=UPI001EE41EB2|nr:lysylphosphatidylglycerol synthase transmembrane domain-containing protein [Salsipaludibacter albus]MBY5162507.1 flippase-like domain-containing protein [Salsipaludibacter albus]
MAEPARAADSVDADPADRHDVDHRGGRDARGAGGDRRRWRLRLFVGPDDEPRARRATDVLVLAAVLVGLALLSLVAVPPSGFEADVTRVIQALPDGLQPLWRALVRAVTVLSIVVVVAVVVRRRWMLARDLVAAAAATVPFALLVGRLATGGWDVAWQGTTAASPGLPWTGLAISMAIVAVAVPHLTRATRRWCRWTLGLGTGGLVLLGALSPSVATATLLVGLAASAAVHLALGSTRGRPPITDVVAVLADLGVEVSSIEATQRQPAGVFLVDVVDVEGRRLDVKVYGGDASDTQFLSALWRSVWYRDADATALRGRVAQVEHEALLTLMAAQAGVATQPVVVVGVTPNDDAVLVLERPDDLQSLAGHWDEDAARASWATLGRLHEVGIAHRAVDGHRLVRIRTEVGLVDFRGATIGADDWRQGIDRAQALVATCLGLGVDPAIRVARSALGDDGLAAILPFLQRAACTPEQHRDLRDGDLDLDDIRDAAAASVDGEAPELAGLRRVTWASALQIGLPVLAFLALAKVVAGLDVADLATALQGADWWLVGVAFVIGQLVPVTQGLSTLGASPIPLALSRVYVLQLAQAYIALTVPTAAARVAMNVRFFQRHGLSSVTALTVGALDSFFLFLSQVLIVVALLVLTPTSLDLEFDTSGSSVDWTQVALIVVLVVAILAIAVAAIPRTRQALVTRVRTYGGQALDAVRGLGSMRRLGLLLVGNLGENLVYALTLGALTIALGYPVGLPELLLIYVGVSLFAGIMPIPGGIGVVEGALTYGLTAAGVPQGAAFGIAILFRTATFYLPPIWGFFAFRWLTRNRYL